MRIQDIPSPENLPTVMGTLIALGKADSDYGTKLTLYRAARDILTRAAKVNTGLNTPNILEELYQIAGSDVFMDWVEKMLDN